MVDGLVAVSAPERDSVAVIIITFDVTGCLFNDNSSATTPEREDEIRELEKVNCS